MDSSCIFTEGELYFLLVYSTIRTMEEAVGSTGRFKGKVVGKEKVVSAPE